MWYCDAKMLEFNQYHKSDKEPFIIYATLEKIDGCKKSLENLLRKKVNKHILSDFSMSTISSFKSIENKNNVYRGKDCMERFCES